MARARKPKGRPISGWLILDKPFDFGSTEAVSKVKWLFKAQKAGHAGTLDPLASGMLPIALGDATKTVPYVVDGRKIYEFTIGWGQERHTDDLEGEVVETSDKRPTIESIEAILPNYVGRIMQKPPLFSAIKIDGARAYDLARNGDDVEIPQREVEIHRISLLRAEDDCAHFEVECGKGTYVRSLARDFGRDLGCFGHVAALRRRFVAPFDETHLVSLETLIALESVDDDEERLAALDSYLISTGTALVNLPEVSVSEGQARRLRSGNAIMLRGRDAPLPAPDSYATFKGDLVAIGAVQEGEFRPRRVFG